MRITTTVTVITRSQVRASGLSRPPVPGFQDEFRVRVGLRGYHSPSVDNSLTISTLTTAFWFLPFSCARVYVRVCVCVYVCTQLTSASPETKIVREYKYEACWPMVEATYGE